MHQDNTPALSNLASFESLENLLAARRRDGSREALMTFEAFEVELGHAVRGLENELKSADLARYDVDAEAVMVNGQEWRQCLSNQPKTYLSASGPITVSRHLYRKRFEFNGRRHHPVVFIHRQLNRQLIQRFDAAYLVGRCRINDELSNLGSKCI